MNWNATSANITFTGVKTYSDGTVEETEETQTVTFEQNPPQGDSPMQFTSNTEYVDLGLPSGLKWAKCNLGATEETGYGAYFSWGDTNGYANATDKGGTSAVRDIDGSFTWNDVEVNYTVKQGGANGSGFTWATEKWNGGNPSYNETYFASISGDIMDSNKVLLAANDAAHVHMGGNWRMPTEADFRELTANTTVTWVTNYNDSGVNGRKFTSKSNETKYIFIPASGSAGSGSVDYRGASGYVWSSSHGSSYLDIAYDLNFNRSYVVVSNNGRCYGQCVRAVLSE